MCLGLRLEPAMTVSMETSVGEMTAAYMRVKYNTLHKLHIASSCMTLLWPSVSQ